MTPFFRRSPSISPALHRCLHPLDLQYLFLRRRDALVFTRPRTTLVALCPVFSFPQFFLFLPPFPYLHTRFSYCSFLRLSPSELCTWTIFIQNCTTPSVFPRLLDVRNSFRYRLCSYAAGRCTEFFFIHPP